MNDSLTIQCIASDAPRERRLLANRKQRREIEQ